jgi:hypothetical protein
MVLFIGLSTTVYDYTNILWAVQAHLQGIDVGDCDRMPAGVLERIDHCLEIEDTEPKSETYYFDGEDAA